jgi:hypothetical protein
MSRNNQNNIKDFIIIALKNRISFRKLDNHLFLLSDYDFPKTIERGLRFVTKTRQ